MNDVDRTALDVARAIVEQDKKETRGVGSTNITPMQLVAPTTLAMAQSLIGMHAKLVKRDEQHADAMHTMKEIANEADELRGKLEELKRDSIATKVAQLIALYAAEIDELKTKLADVECVSARRKHQLDAIERTLVRGDG